ncbi:MAG TPA: phosphoribosylanthranilate isomerase [Candidatus Micrarchaeia archaeon]|nr:phosphoribosylanthranilate isomerase [Candidatus Micrarchaeia archaeon]
MRAGGRAAAAGGTPLWVKVCGVRDLATAEVAVDAGATAIGLVFDRRSPRWIDDRTARELVAAVGSRVDCIGVFVDADADQLNRTADRVGLHALQLHRTDGQVDPAIVTCVDRPLIPAFSLREPAPDLAPLLAWWPSEPILVDAGTPERPGGTGERADWDAAAVVACHRPVWLAGGLGPATVAAALERVAATGVDASSRLESAPGVKDPLLVRAFVAAARTAARAGGCPRG